MIALILALGTAANPAALEEATFCWFLSAAAEKSFATVASAPNATEEDRDDLRWIQEIQQRAQEQALTMGAELQRSQSESDAIKVRLAEREQRVRSNQDILWQSLNDCATRFEIE